LDGRACWIRLATILLRRLLDSTILRSCHDVFTAFNESLMFKEREMAMSLQENFKGCLM
jgi:hypothetical protein